MIASRACRIAEPSRRRLTDEDYIALAAPAPLDEDLERIRQAYGLDGS